MLIRTLFANLLFMLLAAVVSADTSKSPLFVVHFETGPAWDKSLEPGAQPQFREHSAKLNVFYPWQE